MILWIDYENSQSKLKENKLYEEFLSLDESSPPVNILRKRTEEESNVSSSRKDTPFTISSG